LRVRFLPTVISFLSPNAKQTLLSQTAMSDFEEELLALVDEPSDSRKRSKASSGSSKRRKYVPALALPHHRHEYAALLLCLED
jgi:hypothetical protein